MWVSPVLGVRRAAPSRSPLLALVLLLLLVLVACSPAAPNTTPVVDDDATGSIAITVEGLEGVDANITVTGPDSYTHTVTATTTLTDLAPGEYTLVAEAVPGYVVVGDATLKVQVEEDAQTSVTVRYTNIPPASLGSLDITVEGLAGADADITVTGPDEFNQVVTASTVLENLVPGTYTLTAAQVGEFVVVGDASQTVAVTADATATVTVRYSNAAITVSSAGSLVLPLHQTRLVEFSIERRGAFDGPVSFEVEDIPGLTLSPLTGTVAADMDTFTVSVEDDEADLGDHELAVSVSGVADGRTLGHSTDLTISLVAMVTDDRDDDNNPIPGSLRALLDDERTEGATITFEPSLYAGAGGLVIELADTLAITRDVHIEGPEWVDDPLVALDGAASFRVLVIDSATVTLTNLQVQNGSEEHGAGVMVTGGSRLMLAWSQLQNNSATVGTSDSRHGGALWVGGGSTVEIENSRVVNNTASLRGGGIYLEAGTADSPNRLVVTNSVVKGNDAQNGGGIFVDQLGFNFSRAFLDVSHSEITDNMAVNGAGIFSYGETTLENILVQDNVASGDGGGIRNHLRMTIRDSQILGNSAGRDYGGVFNDGSMTIIGSLIEGNTAVRDGGGIFNGWRESAVFANGDPKDMRIERSTVADNIAGNNGGGIHSVRKLTLIDSHVTGNSAAVDGGGIFAVNYAQYTAPVNNGGELYISGTTIDNNDAGERGGGIYSGTVPQIVNPQDMPNAPFTLLNSTLTGNEAQWGGGIYLGANNEGGARLFFNTIARNEAIGANPQTGGINVDRANVTIQGNLIVENMGPAPRDLFPGSGQVTSGGNNFISTNPPNVTPLQSDVFGGLEVHPAAIQLGELLDNGGPTPTMALPNISNASRWVTVVGCVSTDGTPLIVDQRGMPRPVSDGTSGTRCSVGAYQWQGY